MGKNNGASMKKVTLKRFLHDKVTFGKLHLEWLPEHKDLYTIELPWNDNKPNISCIPQGIYNATPYSSSRFKNVYKILNVPDRKSILIHAGNFAYDVKLLAGSHSSDTQGCILIGLGIKENVPMVTKSKLALDYLRNNIGKDNFSLHVKD